MSTSPRSFPNSASRTLRGAAASAAVCAVLAATPGCGDDPPVLDPARVALAIETHGLAGTGLVIRINDSLDVAITADGVHLAEELLLEEGTEWTAAITSQPSVPAQTCTVEPASGTVTVETPLEARVSCVTARFPVSVTVQGLRGEGLALDLNGDGGNRVVVDGDGSGDRLADFPEQILDGTALTVAVSMQPSGPSQTCVVAGDPTAVAGGPAVAPDVRCVTDSFTVGGRIDGLLGSGLRLAADGSPSVVVDAGTTEFEFGPYDDGTSWEVRVEGQPRDPSQTCTVSGGAGTLEGADATNARVACVIDRFPVRGQVEGLVGTGLEVSLDGDRSGAVAVEATAPEFEFETTVEDGQDWTVTVTRQPDAPSQTCTVAGGSGTIDGAAAESALVTCETNRYVVGGEIEGLRGEGLVLEDDRGEELPIAADAAEFEFSDREDGESFLVTVAAQPVGPSQTCVVVNGEGTLAGIPSRGVRIVCATDFFAVSGTVEGLAGTGLLLDVSGDRAAVHPASPGFSVSREDGTSFEVSIVDQPSRPTQDCRVEEGSGELAGADSDPVRIVCDTPFYPVGGVVDGLLGDGLRVALADGTGVDVEAAGGEAVPFVVTEQGLEGAEVALAIEAQPVGPVQECRVDVGAGTVGNRAFDGFRVSCRTVQFAVSGHVEGLVGEGMELSNLGEESVGITPGNPTFRFTPADDLSPWEVAVAAPPTNPLQDCTIAGASGTLSGTDVELTVRCVNHPFHVSGTLAGVRGTGMRLRLSGDSTQEIDIAPNATSFAFPEALPDHQAWTLEVVTEPTAPSQACTVSSAGGRISSADVDDLEIVCVTRKYVVGGPISGLEGDGFRLRLNGTTALDVAAGSETWEFDAIDDATAYDVTVDARPRAPSQTCTITGGTGTLDGTDTAISIDCVTDLFRVGGVASGVEGTGLRIGLVGVAEEIDVSPFATAFELPFPLPDLSEYRWEVLQQPAAPVQFCAFSGGSGRLEGADALAVQLNCSVTPFDIQVAIAGLDGTGLALALNGGEPIEVVAGQENVVLGALPDLSAWSVEITSEPSTPSQACAVTGGAGVLAGEAPSEIAVTCVTRDFSVGGSLAGLAGTGLVLELNGDPANRVAPGPGDAEFEFPGVLPDLTPWEVLVAEEPGAPSQACSVEGGTGALAGSDETGVTVRCETRSFAISGTVGGLTSSGLRLEDGTGREIDVPEGSTSFSFDPISDLTAFDVRVGTQPSSPALECEVASGAGTLDGGDWDSVAVVCVPALYDVAGTVSNLTGAGLEIALVQRSDPEGTLATIPVDPGGSSFAFPSAIEDMRDWEVVVSAQPDTQTCDVTNGSGTIAAADVTGVHVACGPRRYAIGGEVEGVSGDLEILLNGTRSMTVSAEGPWAFELGVAEGGAYAVSIATNPSGQICSIFRRSGVMGAADVTDVDILCETGSVFARYRLAGQNWMDWVAADGGDILSHGDAACAVASGEARVDCIHGGEVRRVPVPGVTSCAGLTARDDLGQFDWICDDSTYPVEFVSPGLAEEAGMRGLMDFTNGRFLENGVTVTDGGGAEVYRAAPSIWWSNTVVVVNSGGSIGSNLSTSAPGTVHLVSATATAPALTLRDRTAILVADGAEVRTSVGQPRAVSGTARFAWVEGQFDASGASGAGIALLPGSARVTIRDVQVVGPSARDALWIQGDAHSIERVEIRGVRRGLWLNGGSHSLVRDLSVADATEDAVLVDGSVSTGNSFVDLDVFNAGGAGMHIDGARNTVVSGLVSTGNRMGLRLSTGASGNTILDATVANSAEHGVLISLANGRENVLHGLVIVNSGLDGLRIEGVGGAADRTRVSDFATADNGGAGVRLAGVVTNGEFSGEHLTGSNVAGDCNVTLGGGSIAAGIDASCVSGASLTTGVTLRDSMVGRVGDAANASADASGVGVLASAFDWFGFGRDFRAWGRAGGTGPFPSPGERGRCGRFVSAPGPSCQIMDFALSSAGGVLLDVRLPDAAPEGRELLRAFPDGAPSPTGDADCDALLAGAVLVGATCRSHVLSEASEVLSDRIGNENGLCESGEVCLFSPDFGSYQGHGGTVDWGMVDNGGSLTGIDLLLPALNGH